MLRNAQQSDELDSMLISKSNGLDTFLKPNLVLKASKYESVTPRTFLATVEITFLRELFQSCFSHPQKYISMKPSKNWKNKPFLRTYRQYKINLPHPSCQLQMVNYRPPPKVFWIGTPTKSGFLVLRCKITGWKC